MFDALNYFIVHIVYQPFFNLLVLIYYFLQRFSPNVDMGVAVIVFTIIFRIIILPLSISSGRTEKEKFEIMEKLTAIKKLYENDPIKEREESKKTFRSNKRIVISETIDVGIQVLIAIMLIRIFSSGLEGGDFNLLYKGIPQPTEPFNLIFMGQYDLSKPSIFINIINSIVIFVAEALNIANSARPATREDKMALFAFPVLAFIYLYFMPAGKKLFVITTLLFSIAIMLVQSGLFWYHNLTGKLSGAFYSRVKEDKIN